MKTGHTFVNTNAKLHLWCISLAAASGFHASQLLAAIKPDGCLEMPFHPSLLYSCVPASLRALRNYKT